MLKDTPDTGYSDIDATIHLQEGTAEMLLASAMQLRRISIENQQLKKDKQLLLEENKNQKQRIKELERRVSELTAGSVVNNYYINNADKLALGDYVQSKVASKSKDATITSTENHD